MNLALFKQRNFTLLMSARFVSSFGTKIQEFALSLYVLKTTQSTSLFALTLIVAGLPSIILGPLGGGIVDMINRKKIIVGLDILNGIVLLFYGVLFFLFHNMGIGMIIVLIMFQAFVSVLFRPAIKTVIPSVVKKEELVDANSTDSIFSNGSKLIAPVVAAILFTSTNITVVIFANALSFIFSGIGECFIKMPANLSDKKPKSFQSYKNSLIDGFRLIKTNDRIFKLILIICVVNFALAPVFTVGMPYILIKVLNVSNFSFGVYETFYIAPLIIAPLFAKAVTKKGQLFDLLVKAFLISGMLIFLISLTVLFRHWLSSSALIFLIVLTFMVGFIITIGNILHSSFFYKVVPNELLGRVGSIFFTMAAISVPLGQSLLGLMLDTFYPSLCISVFALVILFSMYVINRSIGYLKRDEPVSKDVFKSEV